MLHHVDISGQPHEPSKPVNAWVPMERAIRGLNGVSLPVVWWVPTWDVDSDLQIKFQIWKESLWAATLALIKDFLDYLTIQIHQIKVCGWDTFTIHTKLSVWRIQAWIITFQFSGVWLQRVLSHGTWHTGDTSAGVGFVHRKVWGLRIGTLIPSLGWRKKDQSLCFCRLEISTSPEHSP